MSPSGTLTPSAPVVPLRTTFTVVANHGLANAIATVKVTGVSPSTNAVIVTPDTVELNAPVNSDGTVLFPTVPPGVPEALVGGPAGAMFSGGVLSAGAAVPGVYPKVGVNATDATGATAFELFDASVQPVYAPVPWLSNGHAVSQARRARTCTSSSPARQAGTTSSSSVPARSTATRAGWTASSGST